MFKKLFPLFVLALSLAFFSCSEDDNPVAPTEISNVLFVVNGLGETISLIDLDTDSVFNNIYTTGQVPAEIEYHDGNLFVVNSTSNSFQRIDVNSEISYFTELGIDRNPSFFAFTDDDKVAITNWQSATVSILDLSSGVVETEISVGNGPGDLLYLDGRLYVGVSNIDYVTYAAGQGQIFVIDTEDYIIEDTIDVDNNPGPIFIDQQGEINVVCTGNHFTTWGTVVRINPADNSIIGSFPIGGSPGHAVMDESGVVYLSVWEWITDTAYLMSYDSNTETVIHDAANPLTIPDYTTALQGLTLDKDGNIYVCCSGDFNKVLKIDSDGNLLQTYDVGDGPQTIVYVD